jgi:hypothetical protein
VLHLAAVHHAREPGNFERCTQGSRRSFRKRSQLSIADREDLFSVLSHVSSPNHLTVFDVSCSRLVKEKKMSRWCYIWF